MKHPLIKITAWDLPPTYIVGQKLSINKLTAKGDPETSEESLSITAVTQGCSLGDHSTQGSLRKQLTNGPLQQRLLCAEFLVIPLHSGMILNTQSSGRTFHKDHSVPSPCYSQCTKLLRISLCTGIILNMHLRNHSSSHGSCNTETFEFILCFTLFIPYTYSEGWPWVFGFLEPDRSVICHLI